jgi:hypothetical protein
LSEIGFDSGGLNLFFGPAFAFVLFHAAAIRRRAVLTDEATLPNREKNVELVKTARSPHIYAAAVSR